MRAISGGGLQTVFKIVEIPIVAVKVFRTITHIIARDVLYTHGMSILRGVYKQDASEKHLQRR